MDLRSKKIIRQISTPALKNFTVEKSSKSLGFRVFINWDFDSQNVAGFRIFKAKVDFPLLNENYKISQSALEKLSTLKSLPTKNTTLFTKNLFSQNTKVKFDKSDSNRFDKKQSKISTYNFKDIAFVKSNKKNSYTFIDENIKFGETYAYAISALNFSLIETPKSLPIVVNIEFFDYPPKPDFILSQLINLGALFIINSKNDKVIAFDLYKRERGTAEYVFIDRVEKFFGDTAVYIDLDLQPGTLYEYRAYSVDYFDRVSFDAIETQIGDNEFLKRGITPFPEVEIFEESGFTRFIGRKLDDESIIGYRLERQDVWRHEVGFEIKTKKNVKWPNVMFFDDEGLVELDDTAVKTGRTYRYRITAVDKSGRDKSVYVTPIVRIGDEFKVSTLEEIVEEERNFSLGEVTAEVVNRKRTPRYVKVSWKTTGFWDYVNIKLDEEVHTVDNFHNFFYVKVKENKIINLELEFFDEENNLIKANRGIKVKT